MGDVASFLAGAFRPIARGPNHQFGWAGSCESTEKGSLGKQAGFVQRIDRVPLLKDFQIAFIQHTPSALAGGYRGRKRRQEG